MVGMIEKTGGAKEVRSLTTTGKIK